MSEISKEMQRFYYWALWSNSFGEFVEITQLPGKNTIEAVYFDSNRGRKFGTTFWMN